MIHLCVGGLEQKLTFQGNEGSHLLFHTAGNTLDKSSSKITTNVPHILHKPEQQASMKSSQPLAPLPHNCIKMLHKGTGLPEESIEHCLLEKSIGYLYRTLLGECMYTCITYCSDIGYAVTTLSKFSCAPLEYHHWLLKGVAKYLRSTIN